MNGLLCPDAEEITVTFSLNSDILESTHQTLSIPVKKLEEAEEESEGDDGAELP